MNYVIFLGGLNFEEAQSSMDHPENWCLNSHIHCGRNVSTSNIWRLLCTAGFTMKKVRI